MAQTVEAQTLQRTSGGGDLESALLSYSQILHQDLSRNRFAEEREWYEDALFYQRRQWLKWDSSNKRWSLVKQDPDKPRPMPVTNHFARTINAVANQLASGNPRVNGIPLDDSDGARRGAEFAEQACRAIDRESDFKVLKPLLGKHTVLWGVGVTKDFYDSGMSNGVVNVPQIEVQTSTELGCMDCGNVSDITADLAANPGAPPPGQQEAPCPQCGSMNTTSWQSNTPVTTSVKQFSKGRICTEVRPIFEIFVPRDCQNPNLAPVIQHRYRKPLQVAKRIWGDRAQDLKADQKNEIHEIYLEALRSLVNYNYMHDQTSESVTITESWANFDELPEKLQGLLVAAVEAGKLELGDGDDQPQQGDGFNSNPDEQGAGLIDPGSAKQEREGSVSGAPGEGEDVSEADAEEDFEAPDGELDPVEQLKQWGVFMIEGGGKVLDWGINNLEGKKPFTFWLWELDPANVYPKGLGVDLVPLQKRLNRLDSLMELGIMSNAAGKWLWPTTQTTKPPTGSPSDTVEFDPIGDGKIAPTFVQPSPFHQTCFMLRQAILADFQTIGMTQGIQQGENPQGVTAFRGLAYLGAKADEQISTQRFLWETAAGLRYEKCLILAKSNWTEERKVKVAGFNGRYGMQSLWGKDLDAQFVVEIQPDSTRPMSLSDKQQAFQMLLEGMLVDPADPSTREYIIDMANLNGVNLISHLQYMKADRDLQAVIAGNIPPLNPNIDIQVFAKVFHSYTLTEEFEALPPDAQARVQMADQMISEQEAAQQAAMMQRAALMGAGPGAQPGPGQKLAAAMKGKNDKKPGSGLNGVPGKTSTPEQAGQEAMAEGQHISAQLP
jgi:hypothetical protein